MMIQFLFTKRIKRNYYLDITKITNPKYYSVKMREPKKPLMLGTMELPPPPLCS